MPLTVTSLSHPNTIAKIDWAMRVAIDRANNPPGRRVKFASSVVRNAQGDPVIHCHYIRVVHRSMLVFITPDSKDITELVRKALRKSVKNTR